MKRFSRFYAFTFILTLLATGIFAQSKSWLVKMQDPDVNFWELQKEFNDYWKDRTDYKGNGYKVFKRWEYINETRVLPDGKLLPADHVLKEYEKYMAEAAQLKSASGAWTIVGPTTYPTNSTGQPTGKGRVNVIAFHPTDVNTLFIGAPSGGIWKSVNGGVNWTNLSANIPYLGVSAILINPSNPDIIYIGTGDRDSDDAPGVGVYKSADGGVSWVPMNVGMGNVTVCMMLMHPSDPNTMLAATYTGIFKTTNGGVTWTQTQAGDFRDIKFKPGDPDVVYATRITTPAQYYRSADNGTTWGQVTTPVSGVGSRMVIGVSPANADYVYLVQIKSSDANFKALLRSDDSGLTFTEQSNSPNIFDYACDGSGTASQASYDLIIDVDRTNAEIVYVGSINSWKSTNGGVNWSPVSNWVGSTFSPGNPVFNCAASVHADHHWYEWSPLHSPARLYLGHDGGIAYTADGGTTWTDITTDLAIGQVYKVGQSAQTANNIIAGFQDNGVSATSNGVSFTTVGGGDGGECAINYTNSNFCYRESQLGNLSRSSAGLFSSYSNIISAINDQAAFIAPYMLHKTNPGTMFFGRENVWRSTNVDAIPSGSVTWEVISAFAAGTTIRVVEQSPANLNIVYISRGSGSGSALYRSDNANAAANAVVWNAITKPGGLTVTDIKAHPVDENIVFATAGMQVFKSTDKGITWADITGNLPALFVNCLVLDKDANEGIYIGNQTGVWYKDATIAEWVLFSSGLPPVDVRELEIYYDANPDNSRITAATYGRGIWQSDLIEVNVINSSNLVATSISTTQIDLSWTLNASGDNVLIATSPTTIFGVPTDGTAYTAGNTLPGGGTVIYVGNLVNFNHTGLSPGTNYCYKIWSVNGSNQYSAGLPPVCASTFSHNWTGNVNTDWFNTGNWGPGTVPTTLDGAYFPAGRPNYPLIDAAGATCNHLTIESGASVSMHNSTSYILRVSGNWTNDGTFNRGVGTVEFNGTNALQKITGTSSTDFYILRVDKGSDDNILDAIAQITLNAAVDAPLALISGTFRLSNAASTITAITANGQSAANALGFNKRIWVSAGTLNINSRWRINQGELRITGGTVNIGNANNMEVDYLNFGAIILEGGALNVSAGIWGNASNQSSTGIIAISGGTMTVGVFSNGFARGMLEAGPNCIFSASGGTIVIQRSNGHTQQYLNQSTISSVTGGLLQIGNAATPSNQTVRINSTVPVYNLTVNATNSPTAQLLTNGLTVLNNLTISGGTLNANNLNLNVGGHWTNNGAFTPGTGTVTFDGMVNQNLAGGNATSFNNLTLNNANGLTLSGGVDATVNATLTLMSGVMATGGNKLIIPATGAVARTSGHIFGQLQKHVASGSSISRTFEIGDAAAANYTPATVTFESVSTPGNVIAQSVSGDHPQIGSATLNASKSVNRYWLLTNSGTAFTTYDAVFNFLTADVDPAVNTSTLVCGKYDAPNWTYPTIGARTANSTEITGVASFSGFQLAEPACTAPDVPGLAATVNPTCAGQPTNLSIATGNLNGAADWQWYSGACGGTPVGTGSSVNVSPAGTTTYFARGEGGCVVTPGVCGSISITVNANPIVAPSPSPASVCVGSILNISGNAGGGSGNYTANSWSCSGCSGLVALSNVGTPTLQVDAVGGAPGSATLTYQVTDDNGCTASATVALTINARPVPTFTASPGASVCVNTGVTYTTQSGQSNYVWSVPGTAGVDYTITSGGIGSTDNTVTLQWLTSGGKTVAVNYTNANGCSGASPASNTTTVSALPTISNAGSNQTICANGNAALSANTPVVGTGLWSVVSGPSTSLSQFGNASLPSVNFVPAGGPGAYLIRWTISNPPCAASTSELTVTVVATPTFANAGSAQSICANSSATMAANTPVVGTGTWSISAGPNLSSSQFSNVNNPAAMFTPTTSGVYLLAWSITNPPCAPSVDAVTITVNTLPATPTITPDGPTTFCAGGSVQLTSSAADAYLWSNSEMTQSIVVTTNGSYTVQITDVNGCTATSAPTAVTVNALPATPTITPDGPTTFCAGGSVQLTSSAADAYLWSNSEMTQSIVVTTNGSYTVQITDVNGCTATSAPTAVTVNALPATPTITPDGPTTFCADGSVQLTSSVANAYLWSNSEMTQSIVVTTNGSYTVQITDVNGCTATSAPTAVTVNALPATPTITPDGPTTFCAGGSVQLTSSAADAYLWSNSEMTQSIVVTTNGSYTVQITDVNGCTATSAPTAVTVNALPATPTITPDGPTTFCAGGSVQLTSSAADAYLWSNSEMTQSITVTTSGSYTVQITDVNGCTATSAPTAVTVNALPATPTITPDGPTTFCAGGSVQLTSSAADAYLWSNSEMTQSIVVTTNGSYTVQITDVNGCTATSAPTAVTVNALPVANAGSGTDECDLNTTLAAVPSVGTGTWTYTGPGTAMFAPDANDPAAVATVTAFGTYMFTWTEVNGACTDDETVSVNFNAPPAVTLNDPADVCLTGADMNFTGTPTDANGSFTTTAGAGFTDNGNGTAVLDVSVAGIGTYDVTYTYTDGNGCMASQTVSVSVTSCALNFTGRVIWEADHLTTMTGVKDATTTLSGDDNDTDITNVTGDYSLDAAMGTEFEIKPVKNKPMPFAINGLTAGDASRVQQHVIGAFPFTDPYKLIAADVNKSNSVTAQDASLVSQAVLGNPIAQGFFINTTWRFVPKAYVFPNPASPWGFPEKIVLTGVSGSLTDLDFIGAKLGDVNNTANPANLAPTTPPNLIWKVQDRVLEQDAEFVAEFSAYNFDALLALQFGLNFDPSKLQLLGIETIAGSPMDVGNFGTYNAAGGEVRALLAMAQTLSVPDGTPVFRLKFKVLDDEMKLSEVLYLDESVLPGIAYNSAFAESGVEMIFLTSTGTGDPNGGSGLYLFQNRPNPFSGTTTIGFVLPEACEAQLRVFDVSGRLVAERAAQYPAGKQEEMFDLKGVTGVLYYELITPFGTLSKRMLLTGK